MSIRANLPRKASACTHIERLVFSKFVAIVPIDLKNMYS